MSYKDTEDYWRTVPVGTYVRVSPNLTGPFPDMPNETYEKFHGIVFELRNLNWGENIPLRAVPLKIYGSAVSHFNCAWNYDELEVIENG